MEMKKQFMKARLRIIHMQREDILTNDSQTPSYGRDAWNNGNTLIDDWD